MRTKFEVKLPSEEVIEEQISIIIEKGLPKQKTISDYLRDIWRNAPLWHLLFGRGEWMFSLILFVVGLTLTVATVENSPMNESEFYLLIFTGAPFVFLALTGFSYWNKKWNNTLEIEMTTKYTVYQMLAIRMFVYSLFASFFIITCILVVAQFIEIKVLYSIPIGLSGLFIFAAILLLIYREQHLVFRTGAFCFVWVGGNWGLNTWFRDAYEYVLTQLPIIIYILILLFAVGFFIYALKRFFTRKQGGAFECLS